VVLSGRRSNPRRPAWPAETRAEVADPAGLSPINAALTRRSGQRSNPPTERADGTTEGPRGQRRRRIGRVPDHQRLELIERYQAGERAHALSKVYNLHRATVASILSPAGVRRPRTLTADEIAKSIEKYTAGWSLARIGELLGRDPETIRRALIQVGVARRNAWERS
jgi:hypothetical protein